MLEFGTDGVRGKANSELTSEFALRLGKAVASVLPGSTFLVGRDTRISGTMLQSAFSAGIASMGSMVLDLGVIPSPGVSFLASKLRLSGAVISASHNPFYDNGIKIIGVGGAKLDTAIEREIESRTRTDLVVGESVGTITDARHLASDYVDYLSSVELVGDLSGLKVVLDCANGASSNYARRVFESYGATAVLVSDQPNGVNINLNCGSTHIDQLSSAVVAEGADLGLAFDGDADRVLAVDAAGRSLDGDVIMGYIATFLQGRGFLRHSGIALTVMSNLGLKRFLSSVGIVSIETPVGDRNVFEAMERYDYVLGGEQSGHIILRDIASTGDGMLTGLIFASALLSQTDGLSKGVRSLYQPFPQILKNVRVESGASQKVASLAGEIESAQGRLGDSGRILIRPSGTEPLVRIMVEAQDRTLADELVEHFVRLISNGK
ncbi:MAG: phosphoglucosamine mutase [Actinomycetota bacterium]|nr:phosphoglucosamine mutase [Actinomycetota bacterium]